MKIFAKNSLMKNPNWLFFDEEFIVNLIFVFSIRKLGVFFQFEN